MNYLLINHVPFGKGPQPYEFMVGDLWLQDLRAQVKAVRAAGGRMAIAAPLVDNLDAGRSGSFHQLPITPEKEGFEYFPLPDATAWSGLTSAWIPLTRGLCGAIRRADIVQMDYGGHPFALGQIAWPLAGKMRKKRIWVFDGADPVSRVEASVSQESRPLRRLVKRWLGSRFQAFCEKAILEGDLIFTHNIAVRQRFASVWNDRCHAFHRSFVKTEDLMGDRELRDIEVRRSSARPLRLVTCGRQIPMKATDQVIRAMAIARERNVLLKFSVIGDGESLPSYRELSEALGLSKQIDFLGTVPYGQPLFQLLDDCDVMVITNLTAEISRNFFLAMSRALPIVAYSNPATDELIESTGAGSIVQAGSVQDLAETIVQLHENRPRLLQQGVAGREAAKQNTLESCHRRRAELAAACVRSGRP